MKRYWIPKAFVVATILAVAACDGASTEPPPPEERDESELSFLTYRPEAPPLATTDTTFWAVRGRSQKVVLRQEPEEAGNEGDEFLTFELEDRSLLRRPDGTLFQEGDSIEIRIVVDTTLILAEFEPAGLEFDPDRPAELEIEYEDAEDEFLDQESEIDLWRQEMPGDPWVRVGSVRFEDLDEIEAELTGFTRFALAIGR